MHNSNIPEVNTGIPGSIPPRTVVLRFPVREVRQSTLRVQVFTSYHGQRRASATGGAVAVPLRVFLLRIIPVQYTSTVCDYGTYNSRFYDSNTTVVADFSTVAKLNLAVYKLSHEPHWVCRQGIHEETCLCGVW